MGLIDFLVFIDYLVNVLYYILWVLNNFNFFLRYSYTALAVATVVDKGCDSRSSSILVLIPGSVNPLKNYSLKKISHKDFPHEQLKLHFTDKLFRPVQKSVIDSTALISCNKLINLCCNARTFALGSKLVCNI